MITVVKWRNELTLKKKKKVKYETNRLMTAVVKTHFHFPDSVSG